MKKIVSLVLLLLLCCGCKSNTNDTKEIDLSKSQEAINNASKHFENTQEELENENDIIEKAKQQWEMSKNDLNEVQEELDNLIKNLEQYTDEYRQNLFPSISLKYDELYEKTKQENQDSLKYQIALSQIYGNSDTSSLENISKMQLDKDLKYIESSKGIMEQWCTGKIDFEQYQKLINDLNITYGYSTMP